jgi:hypothetical protein
MTEPTACRCRLAAGFLALVLCGCGVQQVLDAGLDRPDSELAVFDGRNVCRLSGASTGATARMGMDRWFRKVTYATLPGKQTIVFCRVVSDPNASPTLGKDLELNICTAEFEAKAGAEYRVASVDVRNEGEHCHVGYTLEDSSDRPVLGCTVEYGERCPWFGFGWATIPSIGESTWAASN